MYKFQRQTGDPAMPANGQTHVDVRAVVKLVLREMYCSAVDPSWRELAKVSS